MVPVIAKHTRGHDRRRIPSYARRLHGGITSRPLSVRRRTAASVSFVSISSAQHHLISRQARNADPTATGAGWGATPRSCGGERQCENELQQLPKYSS